jgi:hypothetical protein
LYQYVSKIKSRSIAERRIKNNSIIERLDFTQNLTIQNYFQQGR